MNVFATRLKELVERRRQEGLYESEAELARRVGVKPRRFNHWSNGRSSIIHYSLITRVCEELRTHPNYLFGWSDTVEPRFTESVGKIAALENQMAQMSRAIEALTKRKIPLKDP